MGQELVRLRGALDIVLPLRRLARLVQHLLIEGDRLRGRFGGQPDGAGLLVLLNRNAFVLAGGMSDHPMSAVTLGPAGSRVGLNTHRGFTKPAFHWPMFSLGLLVFESMWPPGAWTAASLPLLNGT